MTDSIKQVLIPSAGVGSRLGSLTEHVNKALIQIDGKAVISHIIELYPEYYEFIICLGHKGDFLRQYLEISHPKINFNFVYILVSCLRLCENFQYLVLIVFFSLSK